MGAPATSVNLITDVANLKRLRLPFDTAADFLEQAKKNGGFINIPNCAGGTPWKEDHRPNHAARVSAEALRKYLKLSV